MKEIWIVNSATSLVDFEYILQLYSRGIELAQDIDVACKVILFAETKSMDSLVDLIGKRTISNIICCKKNNWNDYEKAIALEELTDNRKPSMIIFQSDLIGKYLATTLSIHKSSGLVAECVEIQWRDNQFVFSRTAMGDSVVAQIICKNSKVCLCTVNKNALSHNINKKEFSELKIENCDFDYLNVIKSNQRVLAINSEIEKQNENWKKTKIYFGIGRGVTTDVAMKIRLLAEKVGTQIVGTRAAVEYGLIDKCVQVGQSGKYINPEIYVAWGISGAAQHIVGIKNAKCIIAINKDKEAPIFEFADYCVNIEIESIIDELLEKLNIVR